MAEAGSLLVCDILDLFLFFVYLFYFLNKTEFIQNKMEIQRIVMCSSTSFQLIGNQLIQSERKRKRKKPHKCLADEELLEERWR